jgi:hypothetical protein
MAQKTCFKNSHPDGGICVCDATYVMNPQGNVCCGPNAVWQDGKCNPCVKNAHPKIQKINGIDAAVSCEMNNTTDTASNFVNDKDALGTWNSVDFVDTKDKFTPDQKQFKGPLTLKGLTFLDGGKMTESWWTWTKGAVMHSGDKTTSKYEIKDINGKKYMFFEWMSGDVTIRHKQPKYYVLVKQ